MSMLKNMGRLLNHRYIQADEHLLEKVVGLLPLVGEEIANRVEGLPLPLHEPLEVAFLLFLLFHYFGIRFSSLTQ